MKARVYSLVHFDVQGSGDGTIINVFEGSLDVTIESVSENTPGSAPWRCILISK